jgi:drug/metabolite transporter (DMT)-like permease
MAVFSHAQCLLVIVVTALIGMSSFGCWYTAIDNIGAAKALCLNVTYSFWAVVFTLIFALVVPQYVMGEVTLHTVIGSLLMLAGVALANLYQGGKHLAESIANEAISRG